MAVIHDKLSEEKINEIQSFFLARMEALESMRQPLDDVIDEEVQLYNDVDEDIQNKQPHEEQITIPYIYTIVQTMVARLIQALFGNDNYLKMYIEKKGFEPIERDLKSWIQEEMDLIKIKDRSRDFLESALVKRTAWLQLRPMMSKGELKTVDFNILDWYDVWFDTTAKTPDDTDYIIRKRIPLWQLMQNEKNYFNLDLVKGTTPPDDIAKQQQYTYENGVSYYDLEKNNITDLVELKEWYGWYDVSENPDKPEFKPSILVFANDEVLIRCETVEVETKKKFYIFPMRPIRQASSLIGKSVPQLTKVQQKLLNQVISLTADNYKLLVKLMFKYKRDGSVDFDELFAGAGNAIGYEDDPNDVDIFDVPNMQQPGFQFTTFLFQIMQQTTGAVDYLMGTSAARGITETASGIQTITQQALYKFQMMAENVYTDLKDFINYMIIMYVANGKKRVLARYPSLVDFFNIPIEDLEDSFIFDLGLNDLAERREVTRSQFINAINIVGQLLQQNGGNMKELLRQVMERFEMENMDVLLAPDPAVVAQQQQMANMQAMMQQAQSGGQAAQEQGGSTKVVPSADNAATPDEIVANQNTPV